MSTIHRSGKVYKPKTNVLTTEPRTPPMNNKPYLPGKTVVSW